MAWRAVSMSARQAAGAGDKFRSQMLASSPSGSASAAVPSNCCLILVAIAPALQARLTDYHGLKTRR